MIYSTSSFDSAAGKSFSVILGFFGMTISLCSLGASPEFSVCTGAYAGTFSSSFGSAAFFYLSKNPAGGPAGFFLAAGLGASSITSRFSMTFLNSSASFQSSATGVTSFPFFFALSFLLKSKSVFSYFAADSFIFWSFWALRSLKYCPTIASPSLPFNKPKTSNAASLTSLSEWLVKVNNAGMT